MVRAAVERSVRLLLYRTAPMNTANFKFADYAEEVRLLGEALRSHGFNLAWPDTVYARENLSPNIFAAIAMSAVLVFCVYSYLARMGMTEGMKTQVFFAASGIILAVLMLKVSIIARLAGALAAPMIAVEASLLAMDEAGNKRIIPSAFGGKSEKISG